MAQTEVIQRRIQEKNRRIKQAKSYAEETAKKLGPITAVIIGSTSRGDFNAWSDIDVVIISPKLPENPLRRLDTVSSTRHPDIEPIPIRPQDAERLARKKAPVITEIIQGIILKDDLSLIPKLKKIYHEKTP